LSQVCLNILSIPERMDWLDAQRGSAER
jgi:hypothetical protein